MKKPVYILGCMMFFLIIPIWSFAQGDPFPCEGGDPYEECPIDSNVAFLVAGGIGLAWFTLKNKNLNFVDKR